MKKFLDKLDEVSDNLRVDKEELNDDLDERLDEIQELIDEGTFGPSKTAAIQDCINHLRSCSLLERPLYINKLEKLL